MHPNPIGPDTLHELEGIEFVLLCMEGEGKSAIAEKLAVRGISCVDVGMAVTIKDNRLRVQVHTMMSTRATYMTGGYFP